MFCKGLPALQLEMIDTAQDRSEAASEGKRQAARKRANMATVKLTSSDDKEFEVAANGFESLIEAVGPDVELILGPLIDLERPALGQQRQIAAPPLAPLGADFPGLAERDEVADRPGDDPSAAVKVPLASLARAENGGQVARDGGLLSDDGRG